MAKQQAIKVQEIEQVPIDLICESPNNPRVRETAEQLSDLMKSINQQGLLQPIIVRKCADTTGGKQLEVISGHRRLWAFIELGREIISCIIRVGVSDSEATEIQFIENLQRADIHPLMEAEAYQRYCADALGLSVLVPSQTFSAVKEIAMKIGKDHTYVMKIMQLIFLTEDAKKLYLANIITIDHATLLAKMTADKQAEALGFLIRNKYEEDITKKIAEDVKEFREWIRDNIDMNLSQAPFDPTEVDLIPSVPACLTCHKNSAFNTALFPELNGQSVCNDRICFNAKIAAHVKKQRSISKKADKQDFTLLSTDYNLSTSDPMYVKGEIRMKGRYVEVKPGKECEHTKKGQFIDGPKKGTVVLVCSYSKCSKHWKGATASSASSSKSQDDYNSPANVAKREAEETKLKQRVTDHREYCYEVLCEAVTKVPQKLTLDFLRMLLVDEIDRRYGRMIVNEKVTNYFCRWLGYKESSQANFYSRLKNDIKKFNEKQLMQLYFYLKYDGVIRVFDRWDMDHSPNNLKEVAGDCGLDLKAFKKRYDAKLKASTGKVGVQPQADRGTPSQTNATKKKSAKKA